MKININSLRVRLFLWYVGSVLLLVIYFLLFIHYHTIPHGMLLLAVFFVILAIIQFFVIYKITKSITYLSSRIKKITSKNLHEKITDIKSADEIGELSNSFNNLLDRLNEAFQREQQFIGDVAHELKTPIATLKSSFEVTLAKKRNVNDYKKAIEDGVIETDRITATLNDILELAWSKAPSEQKNKKRFNLSDLIQELYEIAQKMAVKKNIQIEMTTTKNIYIYGFKDKLARALLNIIENAIKYSPKNSKVEIVLEKSPNKILISVIDNGLGILEEDIPHVFDRFYRGLKTEKILGSGLGLAIAKSIVVLHGGEIKVKSAKGKGSAFIIVFPHN